MDTTGLRFLPFRGDVDGLYQNENYLSFKWVDGDVYFSVTQMGGAANCHVALHKNDARRLKQAVNEFYDFLYWMFDWCEMVIAQVNRKSVGKVLERCGFMVIGEAESIKIYMRCEQWAA